MKIHKIRENNEETTARAFAEVKVWLKDTSINYFKPPNNGHIYTGLKYSLSISPRTIPGEPVDDPVYVLCQFYIDANNTRHKEIQSCLQLNGYNNIIKKIYLLNERKYTHEELGVTNDKIEQVVIKKRLTYKDVFDFVERKKIKGYIVLCNSDIFLNNTLSNLKISNLSKERKVFCQLRMEYDGHSPLGECKPFDLGRPDSQDSWIWHSNFNPISPYRSVFNFNLGQPGCDNKMTYLFAILGYQVHNEPYLIKTFHYHLSNIRNYNKDTKKISPPHLAIYPIVDMATDNFDPKHSFNFICENDILSNYITDKFKNNQYFVIPRIAGIENDFAWYGVALQQSTEIQNISSIKNKSDVMKNNAGIQFTDLNSIINYSKKYLSAFHKCDIYFDWEPWCEVVKYIPKSFEFITINFKKFKVWSLVLDIFHVIHNNPWTQALRGKRILIISPFINSIREKIPIREKIYGIDLFPDCTFEFIKPPQTQGTSKSAPFDIELSNFIDKIKKMSDKFDIALCSCGGYGNLVCSEIYDMGKSAIYVGGVLQMYFGIYGNRWLRERSDIMTLYANKHWSRPKESERPTGFKNVEGSCYW